MLVLMCSQSLCVCGPRALLDIAHALPRPLLQLYKAGKPSSGSIDAPSRTESRRRSSSRSRSSSKSAEQSRARLAELSEQRKAAAAGPPTRPPVEKKNKSGWLG